MTTWIGATAGGRREARVVAVGHDRGADHPRAEAPRRAPRVLELAIGVEEGHVVGAAEVLAQEVAGAALESLGVAHQALDAVGLIGPGKAFGRGLAAGVDRDGEHVLGDLAVDVEHAQRLLGGIGRGGVGGVALLPQELAGPQEEARAHLPAQDVVPLVVEQRQVAVALDPALVAVPDQRLAGGPDGERLLQLLAAAVGDDRDLGREALDVIGLALEQAHRDQQRKVDVLVAGRLDPVVERALRVLPDGVAMGLDDHRALGRAVLGHLGALHDLDVPAGEVVLLRGQLVSAHRSTEC